MYAVRYTNITMHSVDSGFVVDERFDNNVTVARHDRMTNVTIEDVQIEGVRGTVVGSAICLDCSANASDGHSPMCHDFTMRDIALRPSAAAVAAGRRPGFSCEGPPIPTRSGAVSHVDPLDSTCFRYQDGGNGSGAGGDGSGAGGDGSGAGVVAQGAERAAYLPGAVPLAATAVNAHIATAGHASPSLAARATQIDGAGRSALVSDLLRLGGRCGKPCECEISADLHRCKGGWAAGCVPLPCSSCDEVGCNWCINGTCQPFWAHECQPFPTLRGASKSGRAHHSSPLPLPAHLDASRGHLPVPTHPDESRGHLTAATDESRGHLTAATDGERMGARATGTSSRDAAWSVCPLSPLIACPGNSTCCPMAYSGAYVGCCPHAGGVCCEPAITNSGACCPAGYSCAHENGQALCVQDEATVHEAAVHEATVHEQAPILATAVCKPGPPLPTADGDETAASPATPQEPGRRPAEPKKPTVVVMGDSVSIGYTPFLTSVMAAEGVTVMHSPWDARDGGAAETEYGLQCFESFTHTATGTPLHPEVLLWNFGFHNALSNRTWPGQFGNFSVYERELRRLGGQLLTIGARRVLFALTTPFFCSAKTNAIVKALNQQAAAVMTELGIPTLDLCSAPVHRTHDQRPCCVV